MLIWLCLGTNNCENEIRIVRKKKRAILFFAHETWKLSLLYTFVAQQVEHPAVNREVEGSSPSKGANTDFSRETGTFSRCLGMALKTLRLSCYPKYGWLANLVKALGWSPREVGSKPTPSTNMASWYSGNYVGLSRRRQGSDSPWGRQRLSYSVLRFVHETGCLKSPFDNRNTTCFDIGVSYNGSIRGLGPRGEGSTPSTPTNYPRGGSGRRIRLRTGTLQVQILSGIPTYLRSRMAYATD